MLGPNTDKVLPDNVGNGTLGILREKYKNGTLRDIWRDWKWIWSFSRKHRGAIAGFTALGLGASIMALISGLISKYAVDGITALDFSRLLPLGIAMVATAVLTVVFRAAMSRLSAKLTVTMHCDIQKSVFRRILRCKWMALDGFSTGELLSRFSGDISTVSGCAISWLPNMIIQLFTMAAVLGIITFYDPVMALICCASTPVIFLLSRKLMQKQRQFNRQARQVSGGISGFQGDVFRNLATLKSFGVEDTMETRLDQWQKLYKNVSLQHNRFAIRTGVWMSAMGTAVQYLVLGYCLWRLWRGDIPFGTLVLFLQLRSSLSNVFSSAVSLIPTALSGSVAAERLRELADLPEEPHAQPVAVSGGCTVIAENVSITYGPEQRVLTGAHLQAGPGELVALVGPSGEGKTTLLRMLLGLISPERGSAFLLDGQGEKHPLGADTRSCFAYVPQGNTVMAGTVAENLQLACPDASREEMIAALEAACAWDFVRELPGELNALIGEGGKGLSEGQAQRIAIARALLRKAPVLLLDEVTSALDKETGNTVLENLLNRGVTCILATHRTSMLSRCSRIYRVQDNTVEQITL